MPDTTEQKPINQVVIDGQEMLLVTKDLMNQLHYFAANGGSNAHGAMLAKETARECNSEQPARFAAIEREKQAAIRAAVTAAQAQAKVVESVVHDLTEAAKKSNGKGGATASAVPAVAQSPG